MANTALTQGSSQVWGDQTYLNCRYSVTGTITLHDIDETDGQPFFVDRRFGTAVKLLGVR